MQEPRGRALLPNGSGTGKLLGREGQGEGWRLSQERQGGAGWREPVPSQAARWAGRSVWQTTERQTPKLQPRQS